MSAATVSILNATPERPVHLERRPHTVTRLVVEKLGQEAPRALYRAFDEFNAKFFEGKLGAPLIFITPAGSPRAWGDYAARDVHGLRSKIRIAPSVLARGERFAIDVLLHEMVHAYQSEIDGDTEMKGYRGHGPVFASKCNAIGKELGLPEVGVKKRKGLPDCAQWPVCVRPDGYYPPAPPKKPRKVPTPAPEPEEPEPRNDEPEERIDDRALKQAYERGVFEGGRRAKLHYAKQVRRRARRLRLAYGETNPKLAALVVAEAETIAAAIESSVHAFYKLGYPKKRSRKSRKEGGA